MANSAASLSQLSGLGQSNTISPDQSTQWQDPIFYASALQPEKNEIRLMTIQTGEAHEEIQVNLNVVSLDDNPQFETLSYVWGDPNITRNILLNGSEFPVTTYLYDALKRLRRIHEARIFWIDAICVNQQDLAERSSQVSLMVKIYSECMLCTVWLGEETRTTGKVFEVLRLLAKGQHFHEWPRFTSDHHLSTEIQSSAQHDLESDALNPGTFEPLLSVFNTRWWTRTWTVQEIILHKVSVVKCGQYEISWGVIMEGYKFGATHLTQCCNGFSENFSYGDKTVIAYFFTATKDLKISWEQHRNDNTAVEMIVIFASHRYRQTSDPRDKVYSFLSLSTSRSATVPC